MALNYLDKAAWDAGVYKDKGNDDDTQQDTSSEDSGYSASGILSAAKNFLEHPFQGTGTVIAPNYTPRPLDDSVYSDIPGTPVASGQFGELEDESVRDERMKDSADYMAANWPRLYGGVVAADEGLANVVGGIQNAVGGGNGILTNVQRAEEGMQNYRDQWNNEYGDSYFLNPNKFAADAGSVIGSSVPIMALSALMPGAAVAGGTRALTSALSRAGLGRLAMSEAGQALIADTVRSIPTSNLADSLSEYGTVVNDMMQNGMSEDEARRRAIPMFFKNMALDTFTVPLELGVMKGGKGIATSLLGRSAGEGMAKSIAKGAARTGMLAGASGLTEGYQEGAQNALENDVQGKRDGGWYNPLTWTNEDWEAARGGFVGGALMGVPGNVAAGFHPEARQAPLSAESQEQAQSIKDTLSHGKPAGMSNAAYNAYIELANSGNPDLIKQAASSLESFQQSQEGSQESTDDAATEAYKDYETYDQKQEIENFLDNNTVEQIGGEKNFNWLMGVLRNGTPEDVQHAYDTVIAAEKATAEQETKNRPASGGGSMSPNTGNAMANIVIQAANDSGVEPRLGLAIAARESGGDDVNAISMPEPHDGVYGVMQAQEETVSNMGLDSQYPDWKTDPYQNAMVGMAILKAKIDGENGDVWAGVRDYDGAGEEAEQYRQLVKNNYDNMGDIGGGGSGNVEAPSEAFYDLSEAMNPQVDGMDPNTMAKMNLLAHDFYQKYGHRLLVTSLKRNGDGSSYHDEGHAFDFSDDFLEQNTDARDWLVQQGEKYGLKGLDEFSHPVATTDGGNVHFTDHGGPAPGGASSGVSGKVTSDNGQFERELDQAAQEAKSDMDKIQAQSDQAMNEIMNDDSTEKTAQDARQDAENAQKQAEEGQQSVQDDVVPDVAQTIRDTSNNIDEINTLDGMFTNDSNGNDKFIDTPENHDDTPENHDFIKTNYKDEIAKAANDAMNKKKAPSATPVPKSQQQTPHARLGRILSTYDRKDPKFKEYMNTFRNGTEQEQQKLADDLQTTQELERANSLKGNPLTTQQDQNIPQNVPQQAVEAPKQPEQVNAPVQTKESLETQKKRKIYLAKKQKLMERVPAGKTVKVHASTNDARFDATYKVVPAGDITASHNTDYAVNDLYPAEYQPRDRNRPQMRGQVEKMTKGMKPELLAESQFVNEGAPVINNSGVVLNGNGRVMAVQKAYKGLTDAHKKSAKAYKDYLISIAPSLGIAPEKVQSVDHPVLVRQAADDADTNAIINSTEGGAKLGGAEQAKADADRLKLSTLEQFVDNGTGEFMNPSNREFRRAAASDVFSDAEGNSVFNEKGDLSPTGAFRIRNAIFAKAYNDNYLLTQLSEATDNNSKNIMNAMIAAAPEVAKVNEGIKNGALYPDYDISDVITKTAKTIMSLRNEGKPLPFHLQETDLFSQGGLEAERLVLEFIERNKFKSRTIADMYKGACDRIFAIGSPKQSKLFDSKEAPRISLENIISNAIQEVEHGQSLFDTTEEKPAEKAVSEVSDNRQAEPAGSGRVHQQEAGRVQSQEKEGNEVDEKSKQSDHVDTEPQQTESKDTEGTHAEEGYQGDVQEEISKFHNVLDDEKSTPKQVIDAYKSVVDKVIASADGSRKNAKMGDKIVTDEYQSLTNSKHWNAFMNEDGGRNWHEVATINADAHRALHAIINTAGVKAKEAPSSQGILPYKQAVDDIMDRLDHKKLTPARAINKLKIIMKDANAARWGEFKAMEAIESKEKLSFDDYKMALDLANDAMKKANDMRLEASRDRKARKTAKELESATEETKPTEQPKEKAGFTDDEIKILTDRGFNRWTKKLSNGKVMDRLYIKPEYLGLELTRYKSGNISSAKFNGETISNSEARRIEGTKCYVDVATKEVVCDREDLKQAAQEVIDDALSKEKSQVPAQVEKGNKPDELRNKLSNGGKQAYDYAIDKLSNGNEKVAQSAKENAFIYARMAERWSEIMHEYGNKTYSPEDYTKSHPIVMGQQSRNAQLERAFEQRAWHGSPYDFDSFDLGYIGAGEGDQVHGWGLYFAKDKKISKAYKDIFGYKDIKANVDGKTYHMDEEGDWTVDGNTVEYGTAMGYVLDTISNTGNKEKAIADLESSLNKNRIRGQYADEARKAINILKNRDVSISKGETLYSVEIPNNAYLLDEDKPIYNQSKTVKRSLLKAVQELPEKQQDRFLEKLVPGLTAKSKETIKAEAQLNTMQSAVNGLKELDEKPLSSLPAFRQRIRKSLFEKIVGSDNVEKVISDTDYRNATIKKLADDITKQGKIIPQLHKKDADRSTARRKELKDNLAQTINTYGLNGKHFYESLSYGLTGDVNKQADASKYLDKYGIKGIKYIGNTDGQCFVIFDDKAVQIIDKYNQDVHNAKAAYDASTGAIRLFDIADQSSFIHESAHMFLSDMERLAQKKDVPAGLVSDLQTVKDWAGYKPGQMNGYKGTALEKEFQEYADAIRKAKKTGDAVAIKSAEARWMQERFARGFERYIADGKAPNESLKNVFEKFKDWMVSIYQDLKNLGKKPPKEIQDIMARMITPERLDMSDEKKQTSVRKAGQQLTRSKEDLKAEIKEAFPNAKEIKDEGDRMTFTMPNGSHIVVDVNNEILLTDEELAQAKKDHHIDDNGNVVVEGYAQLHGKDAYMALSQGSRENTGFHEAYHLAEGAVLTDREKAAIKKAIPDAEKRADKYAEWVEARKHGRGTAWGKLFQKIKDFAAKMKKIFTGTETVNNIFRQIESGRVWERNVREQGTKQSNQPLYQAKHIVSTFADKINLNRFVNAVLTHNEKSLIMHLGKVDADEAVAIKEATGYDVSNYEHVWRSNDVRHAQKRHGIDTETASDQIGLSPEEMVDALKVISAPDKIERGSINKEGPSIRYIKADNNGQLTIVEVVRSKRKTLDIKTMWKKRAEKLHGDYALQDTSETALDATSSTTENVAHNTDNVNGEKHYSIRKPKDAADEAQEKAEQAAEDTAVTMKDILAAARKILPIYTRSKIHYNSRATYRYDEHGRAGFVPSNYTLGDIGASIALHLDHVAQLKGANVELTNDVLDELEIEQRAAKKYKQEAPKAMTPVEARREGVKEFGRIYFQDPARAKEKYPKYYDIFEKTLDGMPEEKAAVEKILELEAQRAAQNPLLLATAGLSLADDRKKPKTVKERLNTAWARFYRTMVDETDPLRQITKCIEMELGKKLADEKDPHKRAVMCNSVAEGRASMLLFADNKAANLAYLNKIYKGAIRDKVTFEDVLNTLRKVRTEDIKKAAAKDVETYFGMYLVAQRTEEIVKTHKDYVRPEGYSHENCLRIIAEAPEAIRKAAQLYWKYNRNLVNIMEAEGLISEKQAAGLRKYEKYCPMYRDMSEHRTFDDELPTITAGRGFINQSSGIKKLKGGSILAVINPIDSMVSMTTALIARCERNDVAKVMVQSAEDHPGLGRIIVKDPSLSRADASKCAFTVMIAGKKTVYRTTPELYQALQEMSTNSAAFLTNVFGKFTDALRFGATNTPSFMVRNFIRDTLSASVNARYGKFVPIVDSIRGVKALKGDADFRAKFYGQGVPMDTYIRRDIRGAKQYKDKVRKSLKRYPMGIRQLMALSRALVHKYNGVGEALEQGTRAGAMLNALKAGASDFEAGQEARDVTVNFSRHGSFGKKVNRYVPFFNASIQGTDKVIRTFLENPKRASLATCLYIILPTIILWAINYDDDWYKELDDNTKYTNWALHIPGTDYHWLIPKPQEVGIGFGSGVEAVLNQMLNEDPHAMKAWARQFAEAVTPGIILTALRPVLEWRYNKSEWTGRNLVPERLSKLPPEQQYTTATSELAKLMSQFAGKYVGLSPIAIDNFFSGWFGSLGRMSANALNKPIDAIRGSSRPPEPARYWYESPFIGSFARQDGQNSVYVERFYQLAEDMEMDYKRSDSYAKNKGKKGAPIPASLKAAQTCMKTMTKINKDIRSIKDDPKMDPETKRKRIDAAYTKMRTYAKKFVTQYDK